ncbi:endonuclease III domain-containing protein [Pyrobaculum neutrophilum]|uniref:Adenine DNA glycosylase n=1 Tax=Pyrobaculum neutrophilum (strain DSM 2338 / JCM 9278 / NBRC 100436 / V24Sta) TaxID=444157 RepID=B1YBZ5_PYRNV|nr:glycosylase [Pyrobaculum neutrophilum]ACB39379.1 HhH-GPD family protein [Pyrobaculum neutrophilum V24Sta]
MEAGREAWAVAVKAVAEWCVESCDRSLPWRVSGSPWHVLLAAVLLRKTTVAQVLKVWPRLVQRYSSPSALAGADRERLEEDLKPLGLERVRARLLLELAELLCSRYRCEVPCRREDLEGLPGVGPYIASEVLLLGCGVPAPLLDRNAIRVLERALGLKSDRRRPHTDPALWRAAQMLTPVELRLARCFWLGVVDLGRKVCRPKNPRCGACPLKDVCRYRGGNRNA